ncbi:MAG TPA: DUF58 domain-containing protein [Candidatus Thermoplasmatota archaeon]|nr:DUF58 domain-containing protein [Candidatus Thermoplasmatota archaeon]
MLTRAGLTILVAALALLAAGLAAGNLLYLAAGLAPLLALFAGLLVDNPHGVTARVSLSSATPRAGDLVEVEIRYTASGGRGVLEFHQKLPDFFDLVEGSNLHVAVKEAGRLEGRHVFTMRATRRGMYVLPPLRVESVHGPGIRGPTAGEIGEPLALEVRPKPSPVRRVRSSQGFAKQLAPENDRATLGIRTSEFREIRAMTYGDPVKSINWKATARRPGVLDGSEAPLVNEYEKEGKKAVWLLLDTADYMEVGNTVVNAFEESVKAAQGIAQFFLDRGYSLGAYVYNGTGRDFFYPEVGRKQLLKLQRAFTALSPQPPREGLAGALDRCHRHLVTDRPLIVIVTRAGRADEPEFAAVKRLRALVGRRRRRLPVLVVSPTVHTLIPSPKEYGRDVAALLARAERPRIQRLRRIGASVVEWDPSRQTIEAVLLSGTARPGVAR